MSQVLRLRFCVGGSGTVGILTSLLVIYIKENPNHGLWMGSKRFRTMENRNGLKLFSCLSAMFISLAICPAGFLSWGLLLEGMSSSNRGRFVLHGRVV